MLSKTRLPSSSFAIDMRPVGFVLGLLLVLLAVLMLVPAAAGFYVDDGNGSAFLEAAVLAALTGGFLSIACANSLGSGFSTRQAFVLTALIWFSLPLFGAVPFMIGAPEARFIDAYFEAVSGITTTGSSVFIGLDGMPASVLLWRGLLNWIGGLGISFLALIFLPIMRVGGMQFFRTEGFDTMGKVLPRAADIAKELLKVYLLLTLACAVCYGVFGMTLLDAVVHAFATVATGGFSTADASFGKFHGAPEYVGALFMILSALPYIRFVQMLGGSVKPMLRDPQVGAFLKSVAIFVTLIAVYRWAVADVGAEEAFRLSLFNIVSIFTGTGFASANVGDWGSFAMVVAFVVGMIGGCTSSSSGALSVFRCIVVLQAITIAIERLGTPHRVATLRLGRERVDDDTLNGVMMFCTGYILSIGVLSLALAMTGTDSISALFGVWTSIGNIGYVFGPAVARTGTMIDFSDTGKWILIFSMILGRLGLLTVVLLFMPRFWRG